MPITDDYIETHLHLSIPQLSQKLGIPKYLVAEKIALLRKHHVETFSNPFKYKVIDPFGQEYEALVAYILEKKHGLFVEIAKDRLRILEAEAKQNFKPLNYSLMFTRINNAVSTCCNESVLFDTEDQVHRCNACHDACDVIHDVVTPLPDEWCEQQAEEYARIEREAA